MAPPVVAIISPGAMGSAMGARLTSAPHALRVLTHIPAGRSQGSHDRAKAAKMVPTDMATIAREADWVLSVLPPASALDFAEEFAAAVKGLPTNERRTGKPAFADCNAVSPGTITKIAEVLKEVKLPFVDGSIIGGPPKGSYDPTLYASAEESKEGEGVLAEFEGLKEYGLNVSPLRGEGAGVGAASALKMSYAGVTKGFTGLATTMILAAYANSPATAHALIQEFSHSVPAFLQRMTKGIPDMLPKAYRFDGEMDEIAKFVSEGEKAAGVDGQAENGGSGQIYTGMGETYRRVARAVKSEGEDVKLLKDFVEQAKAALEAKEAAQRE